MGKKPFIFLRLSLLFLICSSCAWAGNGAAAHEPWPVSAERSGQVGGAAGAEPSWRRIAGEVDESYPRSPPAEPAHAVRDGCRALITPAPSLLGRQDQGQIQALSNQLQQLSEQSRSVSQSSQQLSQSLQQATQQLSQTQQSLASARLQQSAAESASRSMSQASADASRRADEASARADRAISQAMQSASQSASRVLSENMASITSSMGASFSSALRLASQSAADAMRSAASVAQKAQADATALRNEANNQIQQAQGAALTVTQTALAVVGGIIGSSLLTGVGFVLVLRHRRRKRRQQHDDGNTGYPQLSSTSNKVYSVASLKKGYAVTSDGDGSSSTYSTDDDDNNNNNNWFKFPVGSNDSSDIKRPMPVRVNTVTIPPRKKSSSGVGVGYAVSYYSPRTTSQRQPSFHLGNPPPPRATGTDRDTGAGAGGGKFALFPPQTNTTALNDGNNIGNATSTNTSAGEDNSSPPGLEKEKESSSASGTRVGQLREDRGPRVVSNGAATPTPTLERWMRDGTSVSPFSTLNRAPGPGPTGSGLGLSGLLGGGRKW